MCMLTYFPSDQQPDISALRNGTYVNNDGHGWAIVTRDQEIRTFKSLDAEEALETFAEYREYYPEGPAMFHSRMATHGSVNTDNVHPFVVQGDSRTVVGHNGILPKWAQPNATYDDRSDTRLFADDLLQKWPTLRFGQEGQRARLGERITSWNKLVILTVDPKFDSNAYIINEKEGIWEKGIWYSNSGYMPYTYRTLGNYSYTSEKYETGKQCPCCLSIGTLKKYSNYCIWCDCCADCEQAVLECICVEAYEMQEASKHDKSNMWCMCDKCWNNRRGAFLTKETTIGTKSTEEKYNAEMDALDKVLDSIESNNTSEAVKDAIRDYDREKNISYSVTSKGVIETYNATQTMDSI